MNVTEKVRPSTDLVLAETLKAEIVFAPGGVDAIIEKIRTEVQAFKGDISTEAGRDKIRSMAYKVARSKTALDDMGKELVAGWKASAGKVDAERRRIREQLDALKDEVRKPLDDWEATDKARIDAYEAAIAEIENATAGWSSRPSADDIARRIVWLSELPKRNWQEFAARAAEALTLVLRTLRERHAEAVTYEAEQAELTRLRREQAEREQRERDARIAAEAAERARAEAEAKAMQEAEEAAARAEAERAGIEREKADALARAEQAERDRIASEQRAEAARAAAAEQAERDRQAAIEAERKRVADAKAKEDAETAKREANKRHLAKINNEVLAALIGVGVEEAAAKIAITAIAQGKIPHTKISY